MYSLNEGVTSEPIILDTFFDILDGAQQLFNFISKEAGTPTDDGGSGFSKIVFAKSNLVETLKKLTLEDVYNMKEKSSKFLNPDLK